MDSNKPTNDKLTNEQSARLTLSNLSPLDRKSKGKNKATIRFLERVKARPRKRVKAATILQVAEQATQGAGAVKS